jgi:hypothetical protein
MALRTSGVTGRSIWEDGGCKDATFCTSGAFSEIGDVEDVSKDELERLLDSDASWETPLALDEDETCVSCELGADSLRLVDAYWGCSTRSGSGAGFAACDRDFGSKGAEKGSMPGGIELIVSMQQFFALKDV